MHMSKREEGEDESQHDIKILVGSAKREVGRDGIWHIRCQGCGFAFVQSDQDMIQIAGFPHFSCPRCKSAIAILGRTS